jgi:hypothetical protein
MIGDQKRAQSTSSNRLAAIDPKSQYAVQPNNKSWDDISWQTLHLFLKIKVLRRSVEATAQSGHSLHLARMSAIGDQDEAATAAMVLFAGVASSLKRCAF